MCPLAVTKGCGSGCPSSAGGLPGKQEKVLLELSKEEGLLARRMWCSPAGREGQTQESALVPVWLLLRAQHWAWTPGIPGAAPGDIPAPSHLWQPLFWLIDSGQLIQSGSHSSNTMRGSLVVLLVEKVQLSFQETHMHMM